MSDVLIHGISVNGDGVGRLPDGRVVFVESALPGDRVRVELGATRKRVQYANLLEILAPSDARVGSRCEIERCGGCVLRSVSASMQGHLKRQAVLDALRRIGGLDATEKLGAVHQFADGWANRHRVRLHAVWDQGWTLGYFERGSRRLVPLSKCPVVWPELETLALSTQLALRALPREAKIDEVELAFSRRDGRGGAKIYSSGSLAVFRKSLDWFEASQLCGVEIEATDGRWRHGNLELRYDHRRADEFDLRFEPGLFTQAYPQANDALVDAVLMAVRPRETPRVLELHAGIGNFSVPLARSGAHVVAYERNRRAAILGRRNGRAPGLEVEVHAENDTVAIATLDQFDVVLLDPPRAGAREVTEALRDKGPGRVVYVSCDPATLARDAATLLAGGYQLASLEAFDMFPQTPHVETLAVFSR